MKPSKWTYRDVFFNPYIFNHLKLLDISEIMFSYQKRVKKAFFYLTSLQRVLYCQIRVSCQTFKMVIQRCFLTPHFGLFKNHWTCQKSCFLIRRGLKQPLFLSDLPPGCLVLPNKSQLSNLQNGHTEMLFFNPPF